MAPSCGERIIAECSLQNQRPIKTDLLEHAKTIGKSRVTFSEQLRGTAQLPVLEMHPEQHVGKNAKIISAVIPKRRRIPGVIVSAKHRISYALDHRPVFSSRQFGSHTDSN